MLGQVIELIEKKERFAITSHIRPDGDSLGSSLALCWILRGLKKDAEVIMCDHVPHAYMKLHGAGDVRVVKDIDREMIYNLAKAIGSKINAEIASCVYAALLTDTGSFHFSNTTERTFKIASDLVRHGAQPAKLSQAIFYNYPYAKIRLVGEVLSTLHRDESGRIAWITMSKEAMENSGASEDDSDGIITYPLTVGDVEAVAFFRELSNSTYRISLRSKNRVNVARVAEHFGGGGHANAAGFTIKANYDELSREVIAKLKDAVANAPAVNGREIKPR